MRHGLLLLPAALLLGACQTPPSLGEPPDRVVNSGGGRDEHGCIISAGYRWCQERQGCIRPWQLVAPGSTETPREAFEQACKTGE